MIYNFDEYTIKQKQLEDYHKKMMRVVDDWVKHTTSPDFLTRKPEDYLMSIDFHKNQLGYYILSFYTSKFRNMDVLVSGKDYLDLLEFMKDPELYKNTRKYNL